ncbi:hypothetical protein BDR05DRAFT_998432 [Suillus weaverae]|nr:hypothetical protein BDR05DRAFT_998432 [Suillus weaverae]
MPTCASQWVSPLRRGASTLACGCSLLVLSSIVLVAHPPLSNQNAPCRTSVVLWTGAWEALYVKRHQVALRIQALMNPTLPEAAAVLNPSSSNMDSTMGRSNDDEWVYESDHDVPELEHPPSHTHNILQVETQRRTLPDKTSRTLYGN